MWSQDLYLFPLLEIRIGELYGVLEIEPRPTLYKTASYPLTLTL